jgi:anti-sigma-K factor RskA
MSMKHTQLTEDLQEQASLYAAGAMTDSERQAYARHLEEDQCAVCRSEVNELQSAISLLAFSAPEVTPSANVKARLMEQALSAMPPRTVVERARPRFRWLEWMSTAVAIASIAVAFVLLRSNADLRRLAAELNSRIARLEVQLVGERTTIAFLTSADRVVNLAGQGTSVQARGRLFWDQQRKRWSLYIRDLPPVPADKSYQLWFVPKSGNPVSAQVFNTAADGSIVIDIPVPDTIGDLQAAAVTTEPAGGVPQPTGPFSLLGAL